MLKITFSKECAIKKGTITTDIIWSWVSDRRAQELQKKRDNYTTPLCSQEMEELSAAHVQRAFWTTQADNHSEASAATAHIMASMTPRAGRTAAFAPLAASGATAGAPDSQAISRGPSDLRSRPTRGVTVPTAAGTPRPTSVEERSGSRMPTPSVSRRPSSQADRPLAATPEGSGETLCSVSAQPYESNYPQAMERA